jgi:DNA-binding MurR/RpiR family transcriptional regulator
MADVLSVVRQSVPRLSATETRIAQTVIEHPERVVDLTISELAEVCDASQASILITHARENFYRSGAMASRIAQLALVDFLFVRVAQRMYDRMTESLRRTYEAVHSQHPSRPERS